MHRRLFCELSPLAYRISVEKSCALRTLRDGFSAERFPKLRLEAPLPALVCRHNSLIRRTLGRVDPVLQDNKAVNLALAAPKINGILIRPGETFSFWHLVGRPSAANGYRTGMVIANAQTGEAVGGGMCQFSNLIHWMVLHAPLTITEQHHHDQFDLFPDFGRQVPFGTGTSIFYNYLDYRFRNDTEQTYQLLVHTTPTHLCGELRTDAPLAVKYHIAAENERFVREDGVVYRCGEVYRTMVDKTTGNVLSRELLRRNHARVLYDTPREKSRIGQDRMRERESYREIILENIDYDILTQDEKLDRDRLDELVELMVDTVCSNREMIRIAGDDYPAEVVRSRFLKLNASHIEYVLDRMRENTTYVRNIKKYLLAALYNAPVTMDSYYTSLVSHDLYGSGDGSLQIKSQAPIERKVQSGLE